MRGIAGAKLREGAGEKLRIGGETLCEGAGVKLRIGGVTRILSGLTLRGSERNRSAAEERGMLDHESEGTLRRTLSRGMTWRVSARGRTSGEGRNCSRVKLVRAGATRIAAAGGASRKLGTERAGTRAADRSGPRGAMLGAMRAERMLGDAGLRMEGCAGARYGVG
jgi:hypothetical protein